MPEPATPTRVYVCGRIAVVLDGVDHPVPTGRCQLLLARLAVSRARAVPRDELVELLWPDRLPETPRAALSVVLSRLRSALGRDVVSGRDDLRLTLPGAWIDWEAAAEALHRAESAVLRRRWADAWAPARVALAICERGFLPGEDSAWAIEQRAELEARRIRALRCVGDAALGIGGGDLPAAERAGRALVACAPFEGAGSRILMAALQRRGEVAEALRVYEVHRRLLRDELGTTPAPDLTEAYRQLLAFGASEVRGPRPGC